MCGSYGRAANSRRQKHHCVGRARQPKTAAAAAALARRLLAMQVEPSVAALPW